MPTILQELGWRVFFYPNERNEPIHVHCLKAEKECKFWVDVPGFDLVEEFTLNMSPRDKREIRKILFAHFDVIAEKWTELDEDLSVDGLLGIQHLPKLKSVEIRSDGVTH